MEQISKFEFSKFKYNLKLSAAIDESLYIDLEKWRTLFYKMGLIGEYPTKRIEFGSISRRVKLDDDSFIINGSSTGNLANLAGAHYTKVIKCDLKRTSIQATGPISPCLQTYIHHAVYESYPQINYIFHIHQKKLWSYLETNGYEVIESNIEKNSSLMTNSIQASIRNKKNGIFRLKNETLGMMAFGSSAEEVGKFILEILKQSRT
jgi:hypothetical protein